ncbi:MAG: lysine--tRNA ligase [Thermoanaerobaculia bacterium]|nr:lysine--tRNA ligase [Thermoanaerobaculia bacterium]
MSELNEQILNRRRKLDELVELGVQAFPHSFDHDGEPPEIHRRFGHLDGDALDAAATVVRVPGRVRAIRGHGKVQFIDLGEGDDKLQLFVRRPQMSDEVLALLDRLDLGDVVGARGVVMRTRAGELSLLLQDLVLLAKAQRPLPEKWHGLTDVEVRYRKRYLDLMVNEESRRVFELRSRLVREIRRFLDDRGFLEVETPMMHLMAGGAAAKPFATHHNALDLELYLRIAPELFLKRLTVGGFHRVYEINRNFRNEGISTQHNPEFTMLEFYWAFVDYEALIQLTEELFCHLEERLLDDSGLRWNGERLDLTRPWRRYSVREAITHFAGIVAERLETIEDVEAELKARSIDLPATRSYGHLLMALFDETVERHLVQPTFIVDYPVDISPLSKQREDDPRFVERFELFIGGMEVANAFSELNDPRLQADRFREQLAARDAGDVEAHGFDADYIEALEMGMPPAGGEGIGIDRLTMLFADRQSIRDVILFPLMRPVAPRDETSEAEPPGEGSTADGDPGSESDSSPEDQ